MLSLHTLILSVISFLVLVAAIVYHSSNAQMFSTILDDDMSSKCAIVVGSGLAGLSAASQLVKQNVTVRVLERATKPGGNSIKASSGINGAPTKYQPVQEPENAFYSDTVVSAGKRMSNFTAERERLVRTLTEGSAGAVQWLEEKGVDLSKVAQLGGHSYARTHRGTGPPPGFAIISALLKGLQESPLFHLQTSCTVTKVLQERKRVTGVEYMDANGNYEELHGPVIFASGGFGGDAKGLLARYRPDLAGYSSTNDPRPGTQPLLTAAGARLIDMDSVQVHPTGFVDPADPAAPLKFLAGEVLRGEGGVLLLNGKRFVNELDTRENVANAITSTPSTSESPRQWEVQLVLDEASYNAAKSHVDFYVFKGLMRKTTLSELGSEALETIRQYAETVSSGAEDAFERKAFGQWGLRAPAPESAVYVGTVTPLIHYTMGGVLISEKSEVLSTDNRPIEGVWGAGEITGGLHGQNRLGGSSLLECVVFGRIAGDQCAGFLKNIDIGEHGGWTR
ncbi:uncharacterized protein EKO05_0010687 [Ascochyta rabiei]|uniref:Fumarate reductase n=1 Tax=Didymella rabiei TaxID=5454 RepID=A0A163L232_DIDRA|nr:uncharacterized protein EKO05_0010687 [Ascochyta rabiei]KZM27444.1 succinate dehydrogenase [Ascochyta rabiei]UPX20457.1 hypothetical protein EKO05_0010687 [Ascochyta rabiei]